MATTVKPLAVRKLADKSDGERVTRYDPETGDPYLVDPAEWSRDDPSTWVSKPWPLAGVRIEGDVPKATVVPTSFVVRGVSEGWIELVNPQMVFRPGGPPQDEWRVTHAFTHADALVVKAVDGDVRYRVVRQPDKYAIQSTEVVNEEKNLVKVTVHPTKKVTSEIYANGETEILWSYHLELES